MRTKSRTKSRGRNSSREDLVEGGGFVGNSIINMFFCLRVAGIDSLAGCIDNWL